MEQCLQLQQQEWDTIVEGTGAEAAMRQWEKRTKALKPIDVDWRAKKTSNNNNKQKSSADLLGDHQTEVDIMVVETDEDVDANSDTESETDDEFAQFVDAPEEIEAAVDIEEPPGWDAGAAAHHEDQVFQQSATRARTSWINTHRGVVCASQGFDDDGVERDQTGNTGSEPYGQRVENSDLRRVAVATPQDRNTAKSKTAIRHEQRDRKRTRETDNPASEEQYRHQQALQMIVGETGVFLQANNSAVPWEHRGILGHAGERRGGGAMVLAHD